MKKYQYAHWVSDEVGTAVPTSETAGWDKIVTTLSNFGKDGWEVIETTRDLFGGGGHDHHNYRVRFLLKREIE